jgi:hypothetical protein
MTDYDKVISIGNKDKIIRDLVIALEESVKLQSHYAYLLNMYDGGERTLFKNADAWLKRLNEMRME